MVAWDALSDEGVEPVVPTMSQQADGYFLFPTFSPQAPDPSSSLGGYELWRQAGVDVFMYVVRGGTHIEWSVVPYTSATTYGMAMTTYCTLAWIDRWVPRDRSLRRAAFGALISGPRACPRTRGAPTTSRRGATPPSPCGRPDAKAGQWSIETVDLRKGAGRSAVGDWAGSNDDREGRILP